MTPTRADLERLIETWRKEADDRERTIGWHDSVCARLDKASDQLAALLTSEGPAPTCAWKANEDGAWHTDCGEIWEFNYGGPTENKQRFCGYCGGALVEVPFVYTDADRSTP